jgi:hypothetical protein
MELTILLSELNGLQGRELSTASDTPDLDLVQQWLLQPPEHLPHQERSRCSGECMRVRHAISSVLALGAAAPYGH